MQQCICPCSWSCMWTRCLIDLIRAWERTSRSSCLGGSINKSANYYFNLRSPLGTLMSHTSIRTRALETLASVRTCFMSACLTVVDSIVIVARKVVPCRTTNRRELSLTEKKE